MALQDYAITQLVGSEVRMRIIEALASRERTLGELAALAGVTPQAVLKHLALLEKGRLVDEVEFSEGLVRKAYRLSAVVDVDVGSKRGMKSLHVLIGLRDKSPGRSEGNKDTLQNHLLRLQEERRIVRRKMKSLREREARLFEEICYLLADEEEILKNAGCSFMEALVLRTYVRAGGEEEAMSLAKTLKIQPIRFQTMLRLLGKIV